MTERAIILADGENLVFRYEELIRAGRKPRKLVEYVEGLLVWHDLVTFVHRIHFVRVSYYTTFVGDEDALSKSRERICAVSWEDQSTIDPHGTGRLCPHVFKKKCKSQGTKSVDINLTVDAMRHTYNDSIDILYLMSGDGDYLPLVEEVMRQGKRVWVGAFSSGLEPRLRYVPDKFVDLDETFLVEAG